MTREVAIEERRHGTLHYLIAGRGPALLAFHGAVGNAESLRWFVTAFAHSFRVIVPSLGEANDVEQFCDDVAAMLDAENVPTAALFGISFGGLLAQAFVARHGARASRLILMSCGATRRTSTIFYALVGCIARALPEPFVRGIVRLFLSRRLVVVRGARASARRAIRAHRRRLEQFSERVRKEMVVARFRIATDIHRADDHIRGAIRVWHGRTLVLVAADDPLFGARERDRLRDTLPGATIHTFRKGGHLIPLMNGEEMRGIITRFVSKLETP
jgi:pimeloyl-ACP methyl ester carboxylesterase